MTESSPSPAAETSAAPPSPAPPGLSIWARGLYVIASVTLLLGFFLPWVDIGGVANISGLELVTMDNLPNGQRIVLSFCPLLALGLGTSSILGLRLTHKVALFSGVAVLSYALFTIAYILYTMVDLGLGLVLTSALILLATSLASRMLAARKANAEPEATATATAEPEPAEETADAKPSAPAMEDASEPPTTSVDDALAQLAESVPALPAKTEGGASLESGPARAASVDDASAAKTAASPNTEDASVST